MKGTNSEAPYQLDPELARPSVKVGNHAGAQNHVSGSYSVGVPDAPATSYSSKKVGGGGFCLGCSLACILLCCVLPVVLLAIGYFYLRRQMENSAQWQEYLNNGGDWQEYLDQMDDQTISNYVDQISNGDDDTIAGYISQWTGKNNGD